MAARGGGSTSEALGGGDHHVLVVQSSVNNITGPQTGPCTLYELYGSSPVPATFDAPSNTWLMSAGVHYVLNSNEIAASNDVLDTGAQDSAGIPMVPLLLRYSEVPMLAQHPLRISFPSPTNWFVWPATGCCSGSGPPQGLLYRLKASVNWQATCPVSTYPQAATVLQALQQYGAYMSDHGSPGYIQGVPDVRWDDLDLACIKQFHVSDLEVVDNSALEISPISGQTQPFVAPATPPRGDDRCSIQRDDRCDGRNPATRTIAVSSGALPPGLTLDAKTGTIGGTVGSAAAALYIFGVTVTDTASGLSSGSNRSPWA
ncbi:MAG: Ig domain-containing protein [Ignavibacteriota bacterium]